MQVLLFVVLQRRGRRRSIFWLSSLMTLRRRRKFARMLCLSKDRDESQEEGLPFGRSTAGCLCAQEEG